MDSAGALEQMEWKGGLLVQQQAAMYRGSHSMFSQGAAASTHMFVCTV